MSKREGILRNGRLKISFLHKHCLGLDVSSVVCTACPRKAGACWHHVHLHYVNRNSLVNYLERNTPNQLWLSDIHPSAHPNRWEGMQRWCSDLGSYRRGVELKSSSHLCRRYEEGRAWLLQCMQLKRSEMEKERQGVNVVKYVISEVSGFIKGRGF